MSDLYRSAISARLAKLPQLPPSEDDVEQDEAADTIGSLPGGMGPPAMQVYDRVLGHLSRSSQILKALKKSSN